MGSGGRGARARRDGNRGRGVGAGAARREDCLEWERAVEDKRVRAPSNDDRGGGADAGAVTSPCGERDGGRPLLLAAGTENTAVTTNK